MPRLPISPAVDGTMTEGWMRLDNPRLANPVEMVLLNNLEVLMHQNRAILHNQEQILIGHDKLLKKRSGRGSSVSSIGSTRASSRDETEDRDGDAAAEDTTEAEEAMATLQKDWLDTLFDYYNSFVTSKKKKVYVTRAVSASSDANEFALGLIKHFTEIDDAHPILELVKPFNSDIKLSLYVMLGKKKKAADKEKLKGKEKEKGPAKTTRKRSAEDAGLGGSLGSQGSSQEILTRKKRTAKFASVDERSTDEDDA